MEPTRYDQDPAHDPVANNTGDALSVVDVVRFFRRHWALVFGLGIAAALVVFLILQFFVEPVYESSATLIVVPPTFSSQLKPPVLTVQGYQKLLESDAVLSETVHRLVQRQVLPPGEPLRLGHQLLTRIFVSRRAEETTLAPMIEAAARDVDPRKAAEIANTWSDVFLERGRDLTEGTTAPTIAFIDAQYSREREVLKKLEQERIDTANDFQQRVGEIKLRWSRDLDEASLAWNGKLVSLKKETEDLVAAYQTDTRDNLEAFAREQGMYPGTGAGEEPGGESGDVPVNGLSEGQERALRKIVALRIQLAQSPRFLVVQKAISDDALWQAMVLSQDKAFELSPLETRNLLTQEINPVHSELVLRLSQVELELTSLDSNGAEKLVSSTAGLEKLQRVRSAGLAKLMADRALKLDKLQRAKALDLDKLRSEEQQELSAEERRRDTRLEQIDRDLEHERSLFNELAKNFNQAELAKAEQDLADVRLGSPAVPSMKILPNHIGLKSFIALILGAGVGFLIALMREIGVV